LGHGCQAKQQTDHGGDYFFHDDTIRKLSFFGKWRSRSPSVYCLS
jgi:hypothetical protein